MSKLPQLRRHFFSFANDAKSPVLIGWDDMNGVEFMAYSASRVVPTPPDGLAKSDLAKFYLMENAKEKLAFALSCVREVRNLEGADGAPLAWPADREKIEQLITGDTEKGGAVLGLPPGLLRTFVDDVWVAHFPASPRAYAAVVESEVFPNS